MFEKVNQVLSELVRPQLQDHLGDVKLVSVKEGVAEVKLLGACSNCPSARITLVEIVEGTIKEQVPEIKRVIAINEVNKDMIDFAKKILNRKI